MVLKAMVMPERRKLFEAEDSEFAGGASFGPLFTRQSGNPAELLFPDCVRTSSKYGDGPHEKGILKSRFLWVAVGIGKRSKKEAKCLKSL